MRTGPKALLQCSLCPKPAVARGLCINHYKAAWRAGKFDGQKKKEGQDRKGAVLSFWVSDDLAEKLHRLVRVTGFSQSRLLRSALEGLFGRDSEKKAS